MGVLIYIVTNSLLELTVPLNLRPLFSIVFELGTLRVSTWLALVLQHLHQ